MKRISAAWICCAFLLFAACKEKAPIINFSNAVIIDTTYVVSPVPAAQLRNVLMEEFTGASCTNCPAAHATLEALEHSNPGRLNVIGLYVYNIVQTNPPHGAAYDFRDSAASEVGLEVYGGISSLPNGGVDRTVNSGNIQVPQGNWSGIIATRLGIPDSLNLAVTSSYNTITGEDTITATVIYTQPVAYKHNLSIVIVEDSIIDKQEYPAFHPVFPNGVDDAYVFTNVFRDVVTARPFGDPILDTMQVKEAGRVYRHIYIHKPKHILKPEHCRIVAFVNSAVDKHVLQSVQTKMKQ